MDRVTLCAVVKVPAGGVAVGVAAVFGSITVTVKVLDLPSYFTVMVLIPAVEESNPLIFTALMLTVSVEPSL